MLYVVYLAIKYYIIDIINLTSLSLCSKIFMSSCDYQTEPKPLQAGCSMKKFADGTIQSYFRYEPSWLTRTDAFPLDPVNLPLQTEIFENQISYRLMGCHGRCSARRLGQKTPSGQVYGRGDAEQ